jgi:hypothetical protein
MLRALVAGAFAAALMLNVPTANAVPLANLDGATSPHLTLVYEGCGPYGHRGPYGHCRAGGQAGGYGMGRPCPLGFHLGSEGRHCWPN